jgi:hypothetical protein
MWEWVVVAICLFIIIGGTTALFIGDNYEDEEDK